MHHLIKPFLYVCLIGLVLFGSGCLGVLFYVSEQPWVDFSVLEHYNPGKPSVLLDDEGNEWARFRFDKRDVIKLNQIPDKVIHAFLAAEDWHYFKHAGLSFKGIIRSILINILSLRKAQGASTITQQLVRLLFFDTEKSFKRKIKEQILALVVERQFTKEQILETYLNHIYLGGGIYGVEAACQRFWGKHVRDIAIDEAAILAAIVRCPQVYCPLYNPESTQKRRNLILRNMHKLGFIKKDEYEMGRNKPIIILKNDQQLYAPHLKETLRIFLEETIGKEKLYTGGLRIQTTLNRKMQETAEKVFKEQFNKMHKRFSADLEGALLCIEGSSGAVKALIGGCDFRTSQFNRALSARRQMGSTFKPLIFASALAKGKSFADIAIDEPLTLICNNQEWSPCNSTKQFHGPMTLAQALSLSNNIISIKTFLETRETVVSLAQDCGLRGVIFPYPSLALGCVESSVLEAVSMMNIFAHQGTFVEPYMIEWIKDEWGTKIWKTQPQKKQVLSSIICGQVAKVLTHRIEQAKKNQPSRWFDCDALGKTGTTNDARTCWFVGSTPRYTTGVYVGHDDNRSLGKEVFGSQTALPLWRDFNRQINNDEKHFNYDPVLQEITIDAITGAPCSPDSPQALPILVAA